MVIVLIRHAERVDYVNKLAWVTSTKRPWDTPITEHGKVQACEAAKALLEKLAGLNLPNPTQVYSSPLLRCVETAQSFVDELRDRAPTKGRIKIRVDTSLAETVCEEWYRSWALKGISDSTWGGPEPYTMGTSLQGLEIRPEAHMPAYKLYNSKHDYQGNFDVDLEYESPPGSSYNMETCPGKHEETKEIVGRFAIECQKRHPQETVLLISHGGPTGLCYSFLTGLDPPHIGFTSICILQPPGQAALDDSKSKWKVLSEFSTDHLPSTDDLGFATTGL